MGLILRFWRWAKSTVQAVVFGSIISFIVNEWGVDSIASLLKRRTILQGLNVEEIMFAMTFFVAYVSFIAAASLLCVWITGGVFRFIISRTPSNRLRDLWRDVSWVKVHLDPYGVMSPGLTERAAYVIDELRMICGVRDLQMPIDKWWLLFNTIERPVGQGDVKRVKQLYLEAIGLQER